MTNNSLGSNGVGNQTLVQHMCKYIGDNVIIFTTSGGASGDGFSGVLFSVNCDFVRLLTDFGSSPTCPISDVCDEHGHGPCAVESCGGGRKSRCKLGSICDIPVDRIAVFCHNAV